MHGVILDAELTKKKWGAKKMLEKFAVK